MGKITGFLEIERHDRDYVPVEERIPHWHEFVLPLPEKEIRDQAARCMGLRRALLPRYRLDRARHPRLAGEQTDPRLE
jgi:hypothetical protein